MKKVLPAEVTDLMERQHLGVLATSGDRYPYTSLVGFVSSEDMNRIFFATDKNTHKYRNIAKKPEISILINNSRNTPEDFKKAVSVTALGSAGRVPEEELPKIKAIYAEKLPFLKNFQESPDSVLIEMRVEKLVIVNNFQEVSEVVF